MQFNYWDLGQRSRGEIVEVTLSGSAANIRLLDSSNYQAFKAGRNDRYAGGHTKRSPVRLQIPSNGHWYVTIDYGGQPGRGRASVQVIPGNLPQLRERSLPSLDSIRDNVSAMLHNTEIPLHERPWDVFISHATEDKDEVVRPLAIALWHLGLRVWYDEFELRLAGLVTREMTGEQVILPLWHKITKAEVIGYSPSLADKLARSTSDLTVEEIAEEITGLALRATGSGDGRRPSEDTEPSGVPAACRRRGTVRHLAVGAYRC